MRGLENPRSERMDPCLSRGTTRRSASEREECGGGHARTATTTRWARVTWKWNREEAELSRQLSC